VINNIINVILKLFIDHFMLVPIKCLCHVHKGYVNVLTDK